MTLGEISQRMMVTNGNVTGLVDRLVAQNFMDYLLPSAHEVPPVEIVHHETPSPLTVFGQKGSGESGYLGAPAAVASAVNDAVRPLGIVVNSLPIKVAQLGDMIAAAREKTKGA